MVTLIQFTEGSQKKISHDMHDFYRYVILYLRLQLVITLRILYFYTKLLYHIVFRSCDLKHLFYKWAEPLFSLGKADFRPGYFVKV